MNPWGEAVRAAVTHMNAMELDSALALLEPVCQEDATPQSPDDEVAQATALYLKGLVRDRQGGYRQAFEAHRRCIEQYALSPRKAVLQCTERCIGGDVIANALAADPDLLASLPPAHHAIRLPTNVQMIQRIDVEMADVPGEVREETRACALQVIRHDDERAGDQHRLALAVLRSHFELGTPFGLYLRNFDAEASEKTLADGTLLTMTTSQEGRFEKRSEPDLVSQLPLIGLANGVNFRADFHHGIPKLEVANDWWQIVLKIAAQRAGAIFFDYRHPSPGVVTELALLTELDRANDTVVLVADEAARDELRRCHPAFQKVRLPDAPGQPD